MSDDKAVPQDKPCAFPVLWHHSVPESEHVPATVPWEWVEKFTCRLDRNHGQTVKRLAERGGLDVCEIWCACFDKGLWDYDVPDLTAATMWLRTAPWLATSTEPTTK